MKGYPFVFACHLLVWLLLLPQVNFAQQTDSTLFAQLKKANQDTTRIRIYNQLAYNNRYRNVSKLKEYAFKALALADTSAYSKNLGDVYHNVQRYYSITGKNDEAISYNKLALKVFQKIGYQKGVSAIYNSFGVVYEQLGTYTKAIDYHFKSLRLDEKLKNEEGISSSLNNIATIYEAIGQYDKALEYFQKTLTIDEKRKSVPNIAISQVNLAQIYCIQKKYTQAETFATRGVSNAQTSKNPVVEAVGLKCLAVTQAEKGDIAQATANFEKSYALLKEQGYAVEFLELLADMAKYYLGQKKWKKAEKLGEEGLTKGLKIRAKKEIKELYKVLSEVYEYQGKLSKALTYHKNYAVYNDSLSRVNTQNQLIQRELKKIYDATESKKITAITKEINQRNYYLYAISIGLLLVSIFTFFLYRSSQKQKKLNMELKTQRGVFKAVNQHLQEKQAEIEANNQELKFLNHRLSSGESVITKAYDQLQNRNKQLKNNIRAALTIQQAILPTPQLLRELLPEHFIIYLPKDIVSGDFYWVNQIEDKTIAIFADCTGHGVQGAFMSLIGHNLLDKIILQQKNTDPASILTQLNEQVSVALHQQEVRSIEGMDIGVIVLEAEHDGQRKITYGGAKRPLYYISTENRQQVCVVKGVRKSIGGLQQRDKVFKSQELTLPTGSMLYGGTDGLTDQHDFDRKKLGSLRLREVLGQMPALPITEQETSIFALIQGHMLNTEQRDDILWMGIRI